MRSIRGLGGNKLNSFEALAQDLRSSTWDLVEEWLEEAKLDSAAEDLFPRQDSRAHFNELPTLLGGIAKVLNDPLYLLDLEPGGSLYEVAQRFGSFHQESGFTVGKVMADFSLLRQKLWVFCEHHHAHPEDFFELERRLNLAIDLIATAAVDFFCRRSASELLESASQDKLTGFLHARAFGDRLEVELAKSKRYRHPLVVLRADIDDFSSYNESEGRLMGNRMLRAVATQISAQIRASDEAARFGGDEFAIIMPQTDITEARRAAERIRHQVRQLKRTRERPITVSIGGAAFPEDAENRETLINQTDRAMREAQAEGGDTIKL